MEITMTDRVIVLVDMDCFYVQVEQKLNPGYENKPCAVVQYNTWQGGGIIAVNYEARALGVKRGMRGNEAKSKCPDIHLFQVPEVRGKADLTRYREAGASVIEVLCEFSECVERASVDEAYVDLTTLINEKMEKNCSPVTPHQLPNTFIVGLEEDKNEINTINNGNLRNWLVEVYEEDLKNNQRLALAAVIIETMRAAVLEKTTFKCSAGIAHNKMLAKLACGLHKPNKQTILPQTSVPILYNNLAISKVRNLGGKLGQEVMDKLHITTMADLMRFPEVQLQQHFGEKTGSWLHQISRGIEHDPVISRQLPKSIGCGKNFPAKTSLSTKEKVKFWLQQLSSELDERLQKDQTDNKRMARSLTVSIRSFGDHGNNAISRTCPIYTYDSQKLAHDAFSLLQQFNTTSSKSPLWNPAILSMALSASRFEDKTDTSLSNIQNYFPVSKTSPHKILQEQENAHITEPLTYNTEQNKATAEQNPAKHKILNFFSKCEEVPISKNPLLELNSECTDPTKVNNILQDAEKTVEKNMFKRSIHNYFSDTKRENFPLFKDKKIAVVRNKTLHNFMSVVQRREDECLNKTIDEEVERSSDKNRGLLHPIKINRAECSISYANLKSVENIKSKLLHNDTDQNVIQKYEISCTDTDQTLEAKNNISDTINVNKKLSKGFFAQKLEERQHFTKSFSIEKNASEHNQDEQLALQISNSPVEDRCSVQPEPIDKSILPLLPEDIRKELEDYIPQGVTLRGKSSLNVCNKPANENNLKTSKNDTKLECLIIEPNELGGNGINYNCDISEATTSDCVRVSSASDIQMITGTDTEAIHELSVVCKICGHCFPVWEEQEHADFHFAVELQSKYNPQHLGKEPKEYNKHPTTAKSVKPNKVKKRTRIQRETTFDRKRVKHKTLDFFMK